MSPPCVLYFSVDFGCDGVIELGDPYVGGVNLAQHVSLLDELISD